MRYWLWERRAKPHVLCSETLCEDCADDVREALSQENAIPRGLPQDQLVEYHGDPGVYPIGPFPGDGKTRCAECGILLRIDAADNKPYPGSKTDGQ